MIYFFDRLDIYLKDKGLNDNKITVKAGLSNGIIGKGRKRGSLSQENISKILDSCPDLDANWLLTGKGDMLYYPKGQQAIPSVIEDVTDNGIIPDNAIPFYNLPVSAGISLVEGTECRQPDGYIKDIPGINGTEAFLPVYGTSMYPEIRDGAIIGVAKVDNIEYLNTQHKYLIITNDDRMVKYIKYDINDDSILWCVSPNYSDFRILKDDIIELHRVTFVMNTQ